MSTLNHAIRVPVLFAVLPAIALAQNTESSSSETATATRLGEVTITATPETAWESSPGYGKRRTFSATKTDTPLAETPQVVNIVTSEEMTDRQVDRLADSLRYTPGVITEFQTSTSNLDRVRIRGFYSINNFFLEGLQLTPAGTVATAQIDSIHLERTEVIKGPASVLYGQTGTGGLINMQLKRPQANIPNRVGLTLGTNNDREATFDIGGKVAQRDDLQFRITGAARRADDDIDTAKTESYTIMPTLSWKPSASTDVFVYAGLRKDPEAVNGAYRPLKGTLLSTPWGKLSRNMYTGEPSLTHFDREQAFLGTQISHAFSDATRYRANIRYMRVDVENGVVRPSSYSGTTPTISRSYFDDTASTRGLAFDNSISHNYRIGPTENTVLAGFDWRRFRSKNYTDLSSISSPFNLYDPTYGNVTLGSKRTYTNNLKNLSQTGVYLQNQTSLGPWRVLASIRHDRAKSWTDNYLTSSRTEQSDQAWTGRAGVLYMAPGGWSPFLSYSRSFEPEAGTDYFGKTFKPTTGVQWEAGVKYDPKNFNGSFTASVFDLQRNNVTTTDLAHSCEVVPQLSDCGSFDTQTGRIGVRGVELEGKFDINAYWSATAGYAYMDAKVKRDNDGLQGKTPANTPRHMASAWLRHRFGSDSALAGVTAGAGVRYVGRMWAEDTNLNRVPSYTVGDLMLAYTFRNVVPGVDDVQLQLNVTNFTDKKAVGGCWSASFCDYIDERKITVGVQASF